MNENPPQNQHTPPYTVEILAQLAGIPPELLLDYCRRGVLGVAFIQTSARLEFDDETLYELRRVHRLRTTHEVNLQALPLLAELLREIDRLREELRIRRAP